MLPLLCNIDSSFSGSSLLEQGEQVISTCDGLSFVYAAHDNNEALIKCMLKTRNQ